MNINFQNIQIKHEKSQQDAFEKLCCQLFYNFGKEHNWDKTAKYINKNGHAGDAGVESYWQFENNEEYGIQVKFSDKLNNLWEQIDKSVRIALEKHPNLIKYYICTPFDRTDLKQINKNDSMTTWIEYCKKWNKIKNIDFIWIGKSEIESELMKNNVYNIGLIKYWFDKDLFTDEWFKKHFEEITIKADNRYSINLNVETSTKSTIYKIAKLKNELSSYKQDYEEIKNIYDKFIKNDCFKNFSNKEDIINKTNKLFSIIHCTLYNKEFVKIEDYTNLLSEVSDFIQQLSWDDKCKPEKPLDWGKNRIQYQTQESLLKEWNDYIEFEVREFNTKMYNLRELLFLINNKNYLLFAPAGSGKTHLFCDVIKDSIQSGEFIAILLLGHFFYEKTLQESIMKQFDNFKNINELLGALDSYAKSINQTALLMIDGINEWEYCDRQKIYSEIELLKNKIDEYTNLRLIISCREEYRRDIFEYPPENDFFALQHYGFLDNSIDALYEFCKYYKIKTPSTPLLSPDLSNPLILKTLCEAFKDTRKLPIGINGVSTIFQAYLTYLNKTISLKLDLDEDDGKVCKIISKISKLIYQNNGDIHISKDIIKNEIKDIDTNSSWSKTILYNLEKYGLLVINKDYTYISYDRYRDFLIVKSILANINEEKLCETKNKLRENIQLFCNNSYMYSGLIDFLAIAVPEKWGFELIELFDREQLNSNFINILLASFYHSTVQRDINSISEKTIENVEKFKDIQIVNEPYYWETLISAASIENHPLNANYLHEKLSNLSMADIDADWTQFISQNYETYFEKGYHNTNNYFSIKHIIKPFLQIDNTILSDTSIELISTLLVWLTTTTNKELRDIATISAVNLLKNREYIAIKILNKFKNVQDIYLQERLYSIIYGVVLLSEDANMVDKISDIVFANIFSIKPVYPNILIRIDSYGIIDVSKRLGNDISKYDNKFVPPYDYPNIKKYPNSETLKNRYVKYPKKNELNELYSTAKIFHSTAAGSGDFARYIVGDTLDAYWLNPPNNKDYCAWICQKAYDFGWDFEKHGKFDFYINQGNGRQPSRIERIGKKYQWLAYHEYICNLSDNYYKIDGRGDNKITYKPELSDLLAYRRENIDTSFIPNEKTKSRDYVYCTPNNWTQPNIYQDNVFDVVDLKKQLLWLKEIQNNICKGAGLIEVLAPNNRKYLVLDNFITEQENLEDNNLTNYYRDFALHIRSFVCSSNDKQEIVNKIKEKVDKNINGFNIYYDCNELVGSYYMNFLEYPDSNLKEKFIDRIFLFENDDNLENYNTVIEYKRSSSIYGRIPLYQPHSKLINALNLRIIKNKFYNWVDSENHIIFKNTILDKDEICYNVPCVDKKYFLNLINKTDLSIIFSVSTEKRLLYKENYNNNKQKYYPWMYYFTLYELLPNGEINEIYYHHFQDRA